MTLTVIGAVAFAIGIVFAVVAPPLLARPRFVSRRPRRAMLTWVVAMLVATGVTLVGLLCMIGAALAHHVEHVAGHTFLMAVAETMLGWLSVSALGVIAFRIGIVVSELRAEKKSSQHEVESLVASGSACSVGERAALRVVWAEPFVVASADHNCVLFSTRLEEMLSREELRAAVEHEWAHIEGHHDALLTLGRITSSSFPFLPAGQSLMQVMRIATELEADDRAAQVCGKSATMAALRVAFPDETGVPERIERLSAVSGK